MIDSDLDFDNSGSGLTFAVPFFCKICLKAVAFSGENPGEHPIFTVLLLVGVEVAGGGFCKNVHFRVHLIVKSDRD